MNWTWTTFDKRSLLGADGKWEATGDGGVVFTVCRYPKSRRRPEMWTLAYSERPGHVCFTGHNPTLEAMRGAAEARERQLLEAAR